MSVILFMSRHRLHDHRYRPDQTSLNSDINGHNTWGSKFSRRSMKEKLIMKDLRPYDFEPEDERGIYSNGYEETVTAEDGRALAQAFHSNRNSYTSNPENGFLNGSAKGNSSTDTSTCRNSVVSDSENGDVFSNSGTVQSYNSTDNGTVIPEIHFTRNSSFRNSFHDTSTSSNYSETELT